MGNLLQPLAGRVRVDYGIKSYLEQGWTMRRSILAIGLAFLLSVTSRYKRYAPASAADLVMPLKAPPRRRHRWWLNFVGLAFCLLLGLLGVSCVRRCATVIIMRRDR